MRSRLGRCYSQFDELQQLHGYRIPVVPEYLKQDAVPQVKPFVAERVCVQGELLTARLVHEMKAFAV